VNDFPNLGTPPSAGGGKGFGPLIFFLNDFARK
jgi:hypothetical protein